MNEAEQFAVNSISILSFHRVECSHRLKSLVYKRSITFNVCHVVKAKLNFMIVYRKCKYRSS